MTHPQRKSPRLNGFDYATKRAYFITICTHLREWLFGDVIDEQMRLTEQGQMAAHYWYDLPNHRAIELDGFIVMPNHIHGIVVLMDRDVANTGGINSAPTSSPKRSTLPYVVAGYKAAVTRAINRQNTNPQIIWQRSYHDRIIRNERELNHIRAYIDTNPAR